MSHNDNTPDQSGTGAGGSSSSGRPDVPEYGQRVEGAPSGPSYEPPRYGQGAPGDPYSTPQYGQGQQAYQSQYGQGQYGQNSDDQGQHEDAQAQRTHDEEDGLHAVPPRRSPATHPRSRGRR